MKLKLDEDGNVVVKDGMPVYEDDKGKEIIHDAPKLLFKLTSMTEEKDRHFETANKLQRKLELFKGIEPDKAKEAMSIAEKIKGKEMIESGEFEKLKGQMQEISDQQMEELKQSYETKIGEFSDVSKKQQRTIEHLMITNHFAQSPWFSGPTPKTVLSPDLAANLFKPYFKVEGEGPDNIKMVGYLGDEKIPSRKNVGEPADFNEAISTIIEHHPEKDRFLLSAMGGGPLRTGGNFNVDDGIVTISADDARIPSRYRAAKEKADKAGVPIKIV